MDRWSGVPRALEKPISREEISTAIKRLNNNRAVGPDGLPAEYFKYAGHEIEEEVAKILNRIFELHDGLEETQEGYLYPLNKEGKQKTADNTRPLNFFNTIRKIMAIVLLEKIREDAERYIRLSQLAYTIGRSTTEAAWVLQWVKANIQKYKERYSYKKLDLRTAYDRIFRELMIEIVKENNIG